MARMGVVDDAADRLEDADKRLDPAQGGPTRRRVANVAAARGGDLSEENTHS